MLKSLHRASLGIKRYYLRFFAYLVDLGACNSWLLTQQDAKLPEKYTNYRSKKFKLQIASSLILNKRAPKRKRLSIEAVPINPKIKKFSVKRSKNDVRYNASAHRSIPCDNGKCRNCKSGFFEDSVQ